MAFAVNGAGATGYPSAMDKRAFDLNTTPYNKDSVYKCKARKLTKKHRGKSACFTLRQSS